jgi:outer membrane biosynthesis protein TonB
MKRVTILSGLLVLTAGTALAMPNPAQVNSEDKTPLIIQVENHEERIGDLEVKTDNIQTQVDQNQADTTVIQQSTGIAPAPAVPQVKTEVKKPAPTTTTTQEPTAEPKTSTADPTPPPAQAPAPAPAPAPEPHRLTIMALDIEPYTYGWRCHYSLYDGRTPTVNSGIPCQAVGEILTGVNGYY